MLLLMLLQKLEGFWPTTPIPMSFDGQHAHPK